VEMLMELGRRREGKGKKVCSFVGLRLLDRSWRIDARC
jgi:hypothetical protein